MILNNEKEVVAFIKENHPFFKDVKAWRIIKYLRNFKGKIETQRDRGKLIFLTLFVSVTDETFERMKYEKILDINKHVDEGDNIVFVVAISLKMISILKTLRHIILKYDPRQIMWINDHSSKKKIIVLTQGGSLWGTYSLTRLEIRKQQKHKQKQTASL